MNQTPGTDVFAMSGDDTISIFGLHTGNDDIVCERAPVMLSESPPCAHHTRPFIRVPLSLEPKDEPPPPPKKPHRRPGEERRMGGVSNLAIAVRWIVIAAAIVALTVIGWTQ